MKLSGFFPMLTALLLASPSAVAEGSAVPVHVCGIVSPYNKNMLLDIAKHWHPAKNCPPIVVLVTLNKPGKLVRKEILHSSGNHSLDKLALAAIQQSTFSSLPDWCSGDRFQFKITLEKHSPSGRSLRKAQSIWAFGVSKTLPFRHSVTVQYTGSFATACDTVTKAKELKVPNDL